MLITCVCFSNIECCVKVNRISLYVCRFFLSLCIGSLMSCVFENKNYVYNFNLINSSFPTTQQHYRQVFGLWVDDVRSATQRALLNVVQRGRSAH